MELAAAKDQKKEKDKGSFLYPEEILFAEDLLGEAIKSFVRGNLPAALLITGPALSGKSALAQSLAGIILSERPSSSREGGKEQFLRGEADQMTFELLRSANHPDYFEPRPPKQKNIIRIEDLREAISEGLGEMPKFSQRRVFLIDLDCLSEAGQNVLLKSLEEPPAFANFILTARSADKVLPTVMSRVREIRIKAVPQEKLAAVLEESVPKEEARALAAYAGGIYGKALALMEDESFSSLRKEAVDLFFELPSLNGPSLFGKAFGFFSQNKERISDIVGIWLALLNDLALCSAADAAREAAAGKADKAVEGDGAVESGKRLGPAAADKHVFEKHIANKDRVPELWELYERIKVNSRENGAYAEACIDSASEALLLFYEAFSANVSFEMTVSVFLLLIRDALKGKARENIIPERRRKGGVS